ncbi:MAG: hypothetical protein K6G65_04945 [Lachnospiraceae bacterium]|nr:hypothetical protein [Lachnospiraceae bacterium]
MMDSISVVGGADGPTSIFFIGQLGVSWFNVFGLIFIVLLLIPNIIYAIKNRNEHNRCTNKFMNAMEQVGRYGCMFLMIFSIGLPEFGFRSVEAFLVYLFGNTVLMVAYWIVWILYFVKQTYWKQMTLAVIPLCLFLLSGITLLQWPLILFAVIFGIGHIYVTNKNRV